MDAFHRKPQQHDTHIGRECIFCKSYDPEFGARQPLDRLVEGKLDESAAAHLTEDGYVRHRIAELKKRGVDWHVLARSA